MTTSEGAAQAPLLSEEPEKSNIIEAAPPESEMVDDAQEPLIHNLNVTSNENLDENLDEEESGEPKKSNITEAALPESEMVDDAQEPLIHNLNVTSNENLDEEESTDDNLDNDNKEADRFSMLDVANLLDSQEPISATNTAVQLNPPKRSKDTPFRIVLNKNSGLFEIQKKENEKPSINDLKKSAKLVTRYTGDMTLENRLDLLEKLMYESVRDNKFIYDKYRNGFRLAAKHKEFFSAQRALNPDYKGPLCKETQDGIRTFFDMDPTFTELKSYLCGYLDSLKYNSEVLKEKIKTLKVDDKDKSCTKKSYKKKSNSARREKKQPSLIESKQDDSDDELILTSHEANIIPYPLIYNSDKRLFEIKKESDQKLEPNQLKTVVIHILRSTREINISNRLQLLEKLITDVAPLTPFDQSKYESALRVASKRQRYTHIKKNDVWVLKDDYAGMLLGGTPQGWEEFSTMETACYIAGFIDGLKHTNYSNSLKLKLQNFTKTDDKPEESTKHNAYTIAFNKDKQWYEISLDKELEFDKIMRAITTIFGSEEKISVDNRIELLEVLLSKIPLKIVNEKKHKIGYDQAFYLKKRSPKSEQILDPNYKGPLYTSFHPKNINTIDDLASYLKGFLEKFKADPTVTRLNKEETKAEFQGDAKDDVIMSDDDNSGEQKAATSKKRKRDGNKSAKENDHEATSKLKKQKTTETHASEKSATESENPAQDKTKKSKTDIAKTGSENSTTKIKIGDTDSGKKDLVSNSMQIFGVFATGPANTQRSTNIGTNTIAARMLARKNPKR